MSFQVPPQNLYNSRQNDFSQQIVILFGVTVFCVWFSGDAVESKFLLNID